MSDRMKILVLAGGESEEREVSLASARAITASLKRLGHEVSVIDSATGRSLLDAQGNYLLEKDSASSSLLAMRQSPGTILSLSLGADIHADIDLVFLALHGGTGEDGTIQALLELAGKKYTGSGPLASALAMNKAFAKRILKNENIPTPDWLLIKESLGNSPDKYLPEITAKFGYPLIVKPNNSGSTVGLSLVKKAGDLPAALKASFQVSREILVEEYIKGREITVAILGGKSLPLVEIVPSNELYDYQCKYTKGKSQYICPAPISAGAARAISQLAVKAYDLIGCSGLARADFILDQEDKPHFLEINTLPGMTELSLAPMAAREAGMSFDQLVQQICLQARTK